MSKKVPSAAIAQSGLLAARSSRYIADGLVVLQDGGIAYECDTAEEAQAIAKAANEYKKKIKRDHECWEDLEAWMNGG